jgi:hypothetical protein
MHTQAHLDPARDAGMFLARQSSVRADPDWARAPVSCRPLPRASPSNEANRTLIGSAERRRVWRGLAPNAPGSHASWLRIVVKRRRTHRVRGAGSSPRRRGGFGWSGPAERRSIALVSRSGGRLRGMLGAAQVRDPCFSAFHVWRENSIPASSERARAARGRPHGPTRRCLGGASARTCGRADVRSFERPKHIEEGRRALRAGDRSGVRRLATG